MDSDAACPVPKRDHDGDVCKGKNKSTGCFWNILDPRKNLFYLNNHFAGNHSNFPQLFHIF